MEIIKPGKPPSQRSIQFECVKCGGVTRALLSECQPLVEDRFRPSDIPKDVDMVSATCPTPGCGQVCVMRLISFY